MTEPRKRSVRRKLAFSAIACLLAFALLEGATRIYERISYGTVARAGTSMYAPSPEKDVGHTLVPGFDANGASMQIHINAQGCRGHELTTPAGKPRIVCVGGSTTFDILAARDDATWPALLEKKLQAQHASAQHANVEVVNAGVPGYTVESYLAPAVWANVAKLEPDVVVNYFATNEISREARNRFAVAASSEAPSASSRVVKTLTDWSLFLYKVHLFFETKVSPPVEQEGPHDLPDEAARGFEAKLSELVDREHALGAKVALATFALRWRADQPLETKKQLARGCYSIYPGLSLAGVDRAFQAYNDVIVRVAREKQCVLVPVAPALSGNESLFGDFVHFSREGSQRMSEVVEKALEDAHAFEPAQTPGNK